MRLRTLDLIRYGHFTDASLQFPAAGADFHVVFGANEAGKSTAMSAIEDLLFGIPGQSTRNFMHENAALRVGATLDHNGAPLVVRRRKGNKDTLLGTDDLPLTGPDGVVSAMLGGIERAFFCRMFCLDHERLRDGGREIIEAKDKVGATLFAAGAGISGLSERLAAMQTEAKEYWSVNKAGHRKYYQAEQRFRDADKILREQITATKWNALKNAFEEARDACVQIDKDIEKQTTELAKITRIRRVYRNIRRMTEIEAAIAGMGTIANMPADAAGIFESSMSEIGTAETRINTIRERLAALIAARDAIAVDENILLHKAEIERLSKWNIQLASERESLPRRRAELAAAEETFKQLASELGWSGQPAELIARIPARGNVSVVQGLLTARGVRTASVTNARAAQTQAQELLTDIQERVKDAGVAKDVSVLSGIVTSIRALGDLDARLETARQEFSNASVRCRKQLAALNPAVADEILLRSMKPPATGAVRDHRDMCRDLEKRIQNQETSIRETSAAIANNEKAYERLVTDEQIVSAEELAALRMRRDAGWSIIRRRHIDQIDVSASEEKEFSDGIPLHVAYEGAVEEADHAADRRFQNAQSTAEAMVLSRQLAERRDALRTQQEELAAMVAQRQELGETWSRMWSGCTAYPLAADGMLEWLDARTGLLGDADNRDTVSLSVEALVKQVVGAKTQVIGLLADSAISASAETLSLNGVLAAADKRIRAEEAIAQKLSDLAIQERKAKSDLERKRLAADDAAKDLDLWTSQCKAAVEAINLSTDVPVESVQKQIEAIDQMRGVAAKITDLQHERIGKIERDITAFGSDVARLIAAVAPVFATEEAENAILKVKAAFDTAERSREALDGKNADIEELNGTLEEAESSRKDAHQKIASLQETAGAPDTAALRVAIEVSDSRRSLKEERDSLHTTLDKDGDGLAIDVLVEECRTHDLDQAMAREDSLNVALSEARERKLAAVQQRSDAERSFSAVGGDDIAAIAASDRQVALAEMKDAAAQYARLQAASLVLKWAIERFRREKQAPLLKRAGELFALQTGGSFERLTLGYDDKDEPYLAGVRPDGKTVPVWGLSDGSADQLFLALRVAAVEEYLEHANPVPFVADDLFINYDNERAAAGFAVLHELSKKTQVLFFTHHQHLVDVARDACGGRVSTAIIDRGETLVRDVA